MLKELNELMFETADVIGEEVSKVFWRKSTNFVGEELALLLSVSSGAEASVPVLNLGLNDQQTDVAANGVDGCIQETVVFVRRVPTVTGFVRRRGF